MLNIENRTTSSCADELRAAISGRVALPGDELYEGGRRVWNGAVRRRPAIIAFSRQPEGGQAAVRAARRHGLPLSVRGGGHDWAGRALRDGRHGRPDPGGLSSVQRFSLIVGIENSLVGISANHSAGARPG
jgi:FAD/FMN-containing dehydrogenase